MNDAGHGMRIAVFVQNTASHYSGGRYLSWVMTEALAHAGHEVAYVTNNEPVFVSDFESYPKHGAIRIHVTRSFLLDLPEGPFDIVLLVSSMEKNKAFYLSALSFARQRGARLVLFNFETANWFNAYSPAPRDPAEWKYIQRASRSASLVLSMSKEGNGYAKEFFNNCPADTVFDFCHPGINSLLADSIDEIEREKRVIAITRFTPNSGHKGGFDIFELIGDELRGYTLVLLVGFGSVPEDLEVALRKKASRVGAFLDVKYRLSDFEKLREIKRSSLMLFPSHFEGYGYPPLEAQYCGTPCLVFDLPVLREVSGEGLVYVEMGNLGEFRKKIKEVLASERTFPDLEDNIRETGSFERYAARLDGVLKATIQREPVPIENARGMFFALDMYCSHILYSLKLYLIDVVRRCHFLALASWRLLYGAVLHPAGVLARFLFRAFSKKR